MIWRILANLTRRRARFEASAPSPVIVMTKACIDQVSRQIAPSTERGHESIVYLLGLTDGNTALAVSSVAPVTIATPTSVDVEAPELGKVIRRATLSDLQVVGQLHTHPGKAYHSQGDLKGMRIRHPGYFSIVAPAYGVRLPSLDDTHSLIWQEDGFRDVTQPVRLLDEEST